MMFATLEDSINAECDIEPEVECCMVYTNLWCDSAGLIAVDEILLLHDPVLRSRRTTNMQQKAT